MFLDSTISRYNGKKRLNLSDCSNKLQQKVVSIEEYGELCNFKLKIHSLLSKSKYHPQSKQVFKYIIHLTEQKENLLFDKSDFGCF